MKSSSSGPTPSAQGFGLTVLAAAPAACVTGVRVPRSSTLAAAMDTRGAEDAGGRAADGRGAALRVRRVGTPERRAAGATRSGIAAANTASELDEGAANGLDDGAGSSLVARDEAMASTAGRRVPAAGTASA